MKLQQVVDSVASRTKGNPNYPDGTLLVFGAGEIAMQSDEWFHQEEVADLFAAFLSGYDYAAINWREISAISR